MKEKERERKRATRISRIEKLKTTKRCHTEN
jgi:hypothetical protein